MLKRITFIVLVCTLAVGFLSPRASTSFSEIDKDNDEAQQAYRAYVTAWKLKDIFALRNVISDDYMAINSEGKVSDKENEIATAKTDPEWISMTVDQIHTRKFGNTAIASGFISAQGKRKGWKYFQRKGAIPGSLSKARQNLATCCYAVDLVRAGSKPASAPIMGLRNFRSGIPHFA